MALGVVAIMFAVWACNKATNENDQTKAKTAVTENPNTTNAANCCTADCPKGKCTASKSPCSCTCSSKTGAPDCMGGLSKIDDIFEGMLVIEADQENLDNYTSSINYLNNSSNSYAQIVKTQFQEMQNLFINNNNTITTTANLRAFYTCDSIAEANLDLHFTQQEIDNMNQ